MSPRNNNKRQKDPRGLCVAKDRIVCLRHEIYDAETDELIEKTHDDNEDEYDHDGCVILYGRGNVDPAYEKLIANCHKGDYREAVVTYLPPDPDAEWEEDRSKFPPDGDEDAPRQGECLHIEDENGPIFPRVVYSDPFTLRLSTNDPLAGRTVRLKVWVLSVRAAYSDELSIGYPAAYFVED